jgi:hypothetical protein
MKSNRQVLVTRNTALRKIKMLKLVFSSYFGLNMYLIHLPVSLLYVCVCVCVFILTCFSYMFIYGHLRNSYSTINKINHVHMHLRNYRCFSTYRLLTYVYFYFLIFWALHPIPLTEILSSKFAILISMLLTNNN